MYFLHLTSRRAIKILVRTLYSIDSVFTDQTELSVDQMWNPLLVYKIKIGRNEKWKLDRLLKSLKNMNETVAFALYDGIIY